MGRVVWSCVFVFALAVAPVVAPAGGPVSNSKAAVVSASAPQQLRPALPRTIRAPVVRRLTPVSRSAPPHAPSIPLEPPSVPLVALALPALPVPPVPMRETLRVSSALASPVAFDIAVAQPRLPVFEAAPPRPRPAPLVPMYASFATLQALDYHSTTRALSQGIGREANPLARPIVEHPAGFVALKAGATAGMIWASERMWKRHPVQAVVFMAAANTAMAVVVAHNYSIR